MRSPSLPKRYGIRRILNVGSDGERIYEGFDRRHVPVQLMLNMSNAPDVLTYLVAPAVERIQKSDRPLAAPDKPRAVRHDRDKADAIHHAADRRHFDEPNPESPIASHHVVKTFVHVCEFLCTSVRNLYPLNFFQPLVGVAIQRAGLLINRKTHLHHALVEKKHPNDVADDD